MPDLLEELRKKGLEIVYVRKTGAAVPELGPSPEELGLSPPVVAALRRLGIGRLYKHQEQAIRAILNGRNVFLMAGTGLGKTEAFLIPLLERVLEKPSGVRALLIYPTKALARDQLKRVERLTGAMFGVRAMVLDGDTPEGVRRSIYTMPPQLLVTNPDMIHYSLMFSDEFRRLVRGVEYVVLDDMHVYSGVFGMHVAYVMRRLRRLVEGNLVFIGASATVGNPEELAEAVFGEEALVVRGPVGSRGVVNHVLIRTGEKGKVSTAVALLRACVSRGLRTIVFADSHRSAEVLGMVAGRRGIGVRVHRGGLRPEDRREIEEGLRSGRLQAVVSTPTLELGIDIGDLDCAILYSLPPTFSKYLQRAGRVGRRGGEAFVFTLLGEDPISSYYVRRPAEFFERKVDPCYIDLHNEDVASLHVVAAAADRPLEEGELGAFEKRVAERLVEMGLLVRRGGLYYPTRRGMVRVKRSGGLRGVGDVVRILLENGRVLGYREQPMALRELHPGAVYLHEGRPYLVLRYDGRRAVVRRLPRSYGLTTTPLYYSLPEERRVLGRRTVLGIPALLLELDMNQVVYGYVVKKFPGGEKVSEQLLDREYVYRFRTKGILLKFPPQSEWDELGNAEAFHAAEHALITAAEMVVGLSPTDLGGVSFPSGHIYIYDSYPGGSGASRSLFQRLEKAVEVAYRITSECDCDDGCPKCIFSPYCGNNNQVLSRRKASRVLGDVLELRLTPIHVERRGRPLA